MSFNPHQWYLMGSPPREPNTFIGGIGSYITTKSALASLLNLSVGNISAFEIDGSNNVSCHINTNYVIPNSCFRQDGGITDWGGGSILTYYNDRDGLVTKIDNTAFYNGSSYTSNLEWVRLENVTEIGSNAFYGCKKVKEFYFPNCVALNNWSMPLSTSNNSHFAFTSALERIILPKCVTYAKDVLYNNVFENTKTGLRVYAEPTMETINGGGVEGDLAYVVSSKGGSITYVLNTTAPNAITDLVVGDVYGTAIQLTFTPPSSTNTIDFYEVYLDGVYYQNINASGDYVNGLTLNTNYNITVKAVDIYYNKSEVSNEVTQTTSSTYVIPTANIVSYWKFENNVLDSVGSNNGTATAITYAAGQVGNAAVFNGSTSKIQLSDSSSLSFNSSPFSISVNIQFTSFKDVWFFNKLSAFDTNREYYFVYQHSTNRIIGALYDKTNNSSLGVNATWTPSLGILHHIVFTWSGNNSDDSFKVYVDNVLMGSNLENLLFSSMVNGTTPVTLGMSLHSPSVSCLDGSMDEVTIFNKELSAAEVSDIYTTLNGGNHLI